MPRGTWRGLAIGTALCLIGGCTAFPPGGPGQAVTIRAVPNRALITEAETGPLPALQTKFQGTIQILRRTVNLPNGTWTVVGHRQTRLRAYPALVLITLVRTANHQITGALEISGNALGNPSSHGWPLNPICRNAEHFGYNADILAASQTKAEPNSNQDCLIVGFTPTSAWRYPQSTLLGAASLLDQRGIVAPPIAVTVGIGEADARYLLFERLWLNPDLAGIPPDPQPRLLDNAWSASRLAQDTRRQAYVNRLMAWGRQWRDNVAANLDEPAAPTPAAAVANIQ